jgi:CRISPR type II-A-associated protein Csn2
MYNDEYQDEYYYVYDNKNFKYSQKCILIPNIMTYDINDKKILSKVYKSILEKNLKNNSLIEQEDKIDELSKKYIQDSVKEIPLPFTYDDTADLLNIFKNYDLSFNFKTDSILKKIFSYIDIYKEFSSINIFIIPFLASFLSKNEIIKLSQYTKEKECYIIDLEYKEEIELEDKNVPKEFKINKNESDIII